MANSNNDIILEDNVTFGDFEKGITEAFESFMAEEFESAVDSATKASWGGSGYSVELFDDGSYRVLWDNNIGNLYHSSGLILSVPALSDDEWADEDPSAHFYGNAEERIHYSFQEHLKEIKGKKRHR